MTQFMLCTLRLKTQNLRLNVVRIQQFPYGIEQQTWMLFGFAAENSLSYSVVPKVIELSMELSWDPDALDKLSMDRTTASYKL